MSEMPPPALGCASCAARDEEIALLCDQADVQQAQLEELREQVARLERLLSRNSGNSSMPPSSDDLPGRNLKPGCPDAGVGPGRVFRGGGTPAKAYGWQPFCGLLRLTGAEPRRGCR